MFESSKKLKELEDATWLQTKRLNSIESEIATVTQQRKETLENFRLLSETVKTLQQSDCSKLSSRLEDLEIWRMSLHSKLLQKSKVTGKEVLSPFGKVVRDFYGESEPTQQ